MIKLSQPSIPKQALQRVVKVLESGMLVHGTECNKFEQELADYLSVKHALVVSSGTAALHIALLSLNIGPGDAVLVPDFTFAATANAVEVTGAKAVAIDVERDSYNIDPVILEKVIANWSYPETIKAIMPVLEFGNPKNIIIYKSIADKYRLHLIEDAACAIGATYNNKNIGTFGNFGCFSFHPRKTLTTGEGGLIVTDCPLLADKAALIRSHGMSRTPKGIEFRSIGLNYRLTDFQAAIGRESLPQLDEYITKRKHFAELYIDHLTNLAQKGLLTLPRLESGHSWQSFMIVLDNNIERSKVIRQLKDKGIESNMGAQSLSELELYNHSYILNSNYQVGPNLFSQGLVLPLHEKLNKENIIYVCNSLKEVLVSDA